MRFPNLKGAPVLAHPSITARNERKQSSMKINLNLETSRRHSSTRLPPLTTTSTAATNSMPRRLRRRIGRAPMALLALLVLTLAGRVRESGAQGPPTATTLDATDVHANYALLNGTVNPNGGPDTN